METFHSSRNAEICVHIKINLEETGCHGVAQMSSVWPVMELLVTRKAGEAPEQLRSRLLPNIDPDLCNEVFRKGTN
jgi:hypothetical protein